MEVNLKKKSNVFFSFLFYVYVVSMKGQGMLLLGH